MKRILRILAMTLFAFAAPATHACAAPDDADVSPTFDASALREGRYVYRTTLRGESLGETTLEIRRAGPNYRITMSAPDIEQSWEATVDGSFAPLSAHLRMKTRKGPYEMSLQYAVDTVRGEQRTSDGVAPVDAKLGGRVVLDQRVDWAAVMALQAPAGSSVSMLVYDPSTGLSPMLGETSGARQMSGAFGEASAVRLDYRICKQDHVEQYTVYATAETPRYMLREDMPNGLRSELVRVEP